MYSSMYSPFMRTADRYCQWYNAGTIAYAPPILFTKVTILLIYRRVFCPLRKGTLYRFINPLMIVLVCFYFGSSLAKIWQCTPRKRIWNPSVPGQCINVDALIRFSGVFNTVTDVIILLMPVEGVWNLKTTKIKKAGVVLVFSMGAM